MTFRQIFNSAPPQSRRQTGATVYYCDVPAIYTYRIADRYDNIICLDDLLPPSKSSSQRQYQNIISFYRLVLRSSSGLTRVSGVFDETRRTLLVYLSLNFMSDYFVFKYTAYTVGVNFNNQHFVVIIFIIINRYYFLLLILIVLRGLK